MSDLKRMKFLLRFGPSDVANASGSMPFRLLSASPARCGAVTRSGAQCAINAGSSLRDGSGKLVSESVYISSYKELNPSKSPFCLGDSPRNAGLVWGALIVGE